MQNILILCTGNSCRSQIAHGFLEKSAYGIANVYSAGVEKHGLNPKAVATMAEAGIDISGNTSNLVEEYRDIEFDFVITVCDHAKEVCPWFPFGATKVHKSFRDPAKVTGTPEEIAIAFREVREEIRLFCNEFLQQFLKTQEPDR